KKIGDTEYGIGWFPMGGYVKIAGMVDESMDEEFLKSEPKPDEYRAKKNWQKLIIMLGGVTMNVLLGWFIYSQLLFWNGEYILPAENAKYGINCDSIAMYAGFRDGDVILSHDGGKKFESFNSVPKELILDDIKTVEVLRDGKPYTINLPADFVDSAIAVRAKSFIDFRIPCIVGQFADTNVIEGKLQKGDVILSLNDSTVHYFREARGILANFKGQDVRIKYLRGKDTLATTVKLPESGLLGFAPPSDVKAYKPYFDIKETHYSLPVSFIHGASIAWTRLVDYIGQFKLIFHHKAYKQLGGFATIGSMFSPTWDWIAFWQLTAFLSLMLAVMNLLPIPMLDGGYVVLLLIEMISGRQLSDKTVEYIQRVGFVIIIMLILYANGMDLFRHFMK
ncbi:MAG TPA: site-2 protease family protein, partial [Chitinophagales bacterium]|nr:site-2 protease family protein [Chitinophagales bacterium]